MHSRFWTTAGSSARSGEPALGVDGSGTAAAGGGDGLPVGVVDEVARGEHTVDRGVGGAALHHDVALVVEVDLAANQSARGSWPIATNTPVTASVALLAGHGVAQAQTGHAVVALDRDRPRCW